MVNQAKTTVRLGGLSLAGVTDITWALTTGTSPYTTTVQVPANFKSAMEGMIGKKQTLKITDRREAVEFKDVFVAHRIATDSPHRFEYVLADLRWDWDRLLIARDYNIVKRTGDLTNAGNVPVPGAQTKAEYEYRAYSLKGGTARWTAQEIIEDILEQMFDEPAGDKWSVESFPIKEGQGALSIQNMTLNDTPASALNRALAAIPGAALTVTEEGKVVVYNAADLKETERHFNSLPPPTREGQQWDFIDRKAIRPSKVIVYYQREVEAVFEFEDDYSGGTSAGRNKNDPAIENVIPTTDVETEVTYYDYEKNKTMKGKVPAGTWVEASEWLKAHDKLKGTSSEPWTFETASKRWLSGSLDGAWGAGAKEDVDEVGDVSNRVQAFKQHFRQTFRVSRRYMERVKDILAVRVGILDRMTGQKSPARAWGEMTIISTNKGYLIYDKKNSSSASGYRQINTLVSGKPLLSQRPLQYQVTMLDRDIGVFHLSFVGSPYGLDASFVPSLLAAGGKKGKHIKRSTKMQDRYALGQGYQMEGTTWEVHLYEKLNLKVMLTIIPGAPNNKARYHAVTIEPQDVKELYPSEYRIMDGEGPPMEVFVPPGMNTARFAWGSKDSECRATLIRLLGLNKSDPTKGGLVDDPKTPADEGAMKGYHMVNGAQSDSEIKDHAKSIAAEALAAFADNLQGDIATSLPSALASGEKIALHGNQTAATVSVSSAPSARVRVLWEFPGQQPAVNRFALLPEDVRHKLLQILPAQGDK